MSNLVAGMAKTDGVAWFVAQQWMFSPRREMVDFNLAATLPAVLACPVVSRSHCIAELLVFYRAEISHARRSCATLPVRMRWSNQMRVAWRDIAGAFNSGADRSLVASRQGTTIQRLGDIISLRLRRDASSGRRFAHSGRSNFLASLGGLCRIADVVVDPCGSASARAKSHIARSITLAAVVTVPGYYHSPTITQMVV